jgi:hypothetical protein
VADRSALMMAVDQGRRGADWSRINIDLGDG